jgi:hypothetical protein
VTDPIRQFHRERHRPLRGSHDVLEPRAHEVARERVLQQQLEALPRRQLATQPKRATGLEPRLAHRADALCLGGSSNRAGPPLPAGPTWRRNLGRGACGGIGGE